MSFTLHKPCTMADIAEVVEFATHAQLAMFRVQMACGTSFAIRNGLGVAVCCGGYVPLNDGRVETWFAVWPHVGGLGMVKIIRLITLTLSLVPYAEVHTQGMTPAGLRIARALGFRPCARSGDNNAESHGIVWRRQGGGNGAG